MLWLEFSLFDVFFPFIFILLFFLFSLLFLFFPFFPSFLLSLLSFFFFFFLFFSPFVTFISGQFSLHWSRFADLENICNILSCCSQSSFLCLTCILDGNTADTPGRGWVASWARLGLSWTPLSCHPEDQGELLWEARLGLRGRGGRGGEDTLLSCTSPRASPGTSQPRTSHTASLSPLGKGSFRVPFFNGVVH